MAGRDPAGSGRRARKPHDAARQVQRPAPASRLAGAGAAGLARGRRKAGGPGFALGGDQVEGRRAVYELLAAPSRRAIDVWIADDVEPSPLLEQITELALQRHVPLKEVSRRRLDAEAATDAAQGVLAHARRLEEADLARLCEGPPTPFLVVLDGVTDPHNLGAVLRSAVFAGATGAVLARHRGAHVTPTVAKAAAGAIEHLPIAVAPGIPAALAEMSDRGVWTVGLDPGAERSVFDLGVADQPIALVLGAEGRGLGRLARRRCEVLAAIPGSSPLGSLNVAAAAAIACVEIARARAATL